MEFPYNILVIADSNFKNICKDPDSYMEKLKGVLTKRIGERLKLSTVNGRYGLEDYSKIFDVKEIDCKNKTNFIFSIENMAKGDYFDELLIISIANNDPYLSDVKTKITECEKTITQYGYARKLNEPKSC